MKTTTTDVAYYDTGNRRVFLYALTANVTLATNVLDALGIVYDSHDSLLNGIKEVSFLASSAQRDYIRSFVNNGTVQIQYSEEKLGISGGFANITNLISTVKIASTDDTDANVHYLRINANEELYVSPNDSVLAGTAVTAGAAAVALGASTAAKKITLQSDPDNTNDTLVGNAANQYLRLLPGQSMDFNVKNVNLIYVKRGSADATNVTVNYTGEA